MIRKIKRWWSKNGILLLSHGLVSVLRVLIRVKEATAPPEKQARIRQVREKIEDLERQKQEVYRLMRDSSPDGVSRILEIQEQSLREQGMMDELAQTQKIRADRATRQAESEMLKQIRTEAGDDTAKAITAFREYAAQHPESELGYSYLGGALRKAGEFDAAIALCNEAIHRQETHPQNKNTTRLYMNRRHIGELLMDKGETQQSIAHFQTLLDTTPDASDLDAMLTYFYLGNAYQKAGDVALAKKVWKKAVALDEHGVVKKEVAKRLNSLQH